MQNIIGKMGLSYTGEYGKFDITMLKQK